MSNLMDYRKATPEDNLYQTLFELPKIELHRHLEGAVRLSTLVDIAKEHKIDLPGYDIEDFRHLVQIMPDDPRSAQGFLSKFTVLREFYKGPEIAERIAYEAVADAAAENIVYMELRFTPVALARHNSYTLADVTQAVISAVNRAKKDFNIDVRLLLSMNRHEDVELGEQVLELAIEHMSNGVVGLDLAGAEDQFPGTPFKSIFKNARDAGLGVTIHAGEWAGPESVKEAINVLSAGRLGHGVRSGEDEAVRKMACEKGIAFEVCVTSNLQSGVVNAFGEHPLVDLYRLCPENTTINTDDPSLSGINLTDEMVIAMKHLKFSIHDIKQNVLNAANASFLSDTEKASLVKKLRAVFYDEGVVKTANSS